MIPILIYIAIFIGAFFVVKLVTAGTDRHDFTSLKTVTFGDESAVVSDRKASIISIIAIFVLWGAFTGSALLPSFLHAPGPYVGEGSFTYTVETADGQTDDASVTVIVHPADAPVDEPEVAPGDGFAKDDAVVVQAYRSKLARLDRNDEIGRDEGAKIVAVNGQSIEPGGSVNTDFGRVVMSQRGTLNIDPDKGWQMEPIWLPAPENVFERLGEIASEGFRNFTLWEHLGYSLFRVIVGFLLGSLVGIPLGYAMGLSNWFRGWFDPIVEFMRPVPPLALIPLVIIWAGIGEGGKIILLFLAALWIMAIAARSGVSGVNISKVHAAYSLGASKWQVMRHVIIPNSLPEIFTGARVAMGVCWGTVVAAELVAAEKGAGMMIMVASKFQNTDIVIMGIILIGVIGFGIDMLMRWAERILVPWKGKS
ncbi:MULTISPECIES: ABC transporter permease subunit [unclassified Ruegeria]|uniref:ABC transporter permease subunit n=1 Tax=unclassified Ruegeria TaxID=2625375 RepID=UPI00148944D4|nr:MULTISPECIES: ABC transporter permease subunit [unclassified Ruegeria]NOD33308.1 ABC transporter permease subunit [Ruegeria sp. HKCCD7296]NOD48631.1 ABC transporter permease subunit [Ruegeria sp. HKCCD5849]NOD52067.1 ABC transporter permease subunit [Ruegeria sp. HKCCD5851]NOD66725.1 ABC transporter permease subunit [Ruegeria sp. HKCCD7303]NOE33793.1 ABC transporter permease subunit [Ruegeria sp. HKCCD7318]